MKINEATPRVGCGIAGAAHFQQFVSAQNSAPVSNERNPAPAS